jgi:hypothetical protein
MSWARLDDRFFVNGKVRKVGPMAKLLDIAAICFCSQVENDGHFGEEDLPMIALSAGVKSSGKYAAELMEARLWDKEGTSYSVHDYLEYNPSHAELQAKREATKRRVYAHRNRVSNGVTATVTNSVSNTTPLPLPDPLCSLVASSPDPRATGGPILPTTSTRLIHCLKVAMEKARPTRGMYAPGPFSTRDADELLRSVGGEQAAEEIAKRIALFVADDTMTPWTVARFCKVYNGIGAPKPRLPGQRNPAQY